jgi:putative sterol carrier protein
MTGGARRGATVAAAMATETARLFNSLRDRGHEPLLEHASGTLCFELGDQPDDRWFVSVDNGDVSVSHENGAADCTVHASTQLFDELAAGRANATAAMLRGAVTVEGDPELLVLFQRLFPGPA